MIRDCEVALVSGEVSHNALDFFFPSRLPLFLMRRYSSSVSARGLFGVGWTDNLTKTLQLRDGQIVLVGFPQGKMVFSVSASGGMEHAGSSARLLSVPNGWIVSEYGESLLFAPTADRNGQFPLLRRFDRFGNFNRYEYGLGGELVSVTDTEQRKVTIVHRNGIAKAITLSHPTLARTLLLCSFEYDSEHRLIRTETASGSGTEFQYVGHRIVSSTNRLGGVTYYSYDSQGRCIEKWRGDGTGRRHFARDDERGRIIKSDSLGYRWIYTLDTEGRIVREVDPIGRAFEDVYDSGGSILFHGLNVLGPPCMVTWDPDASMEKVVCSGRVTQTSFDDRGRAQELISPSGAVWRLKYDEEDRLVAKVFPSGLSASFEYDSRGDIRNIRLPELGNWEYLSTTFVHAERDDLGIITERQLDLFGNTVVAKDATESALLMKYTEDGLLSELVEPDGAETFFRRSREGQLLEIVYPNRASTVFTIDDFGRLKSRVGQGESLGIQSDAEDRLTSITDGKGNTLTLAYDAVGRITDVDHFHKARTSIEYDEFDNPTRMYNPQTGTETVAKFNEFGEVIARSSSYGNSWLFEYGSAGQLLSASSSLGLWALNWDSELRLISEKNPSRELITNRDSYGRVTSCVDDLGLRLDYEWDSRSRLQSLRINERWNYNFSYDPRGVITEARCPGGIILSIAYDVKTRMICRELRKVQNGVILARRTMHWDTSDCVVGYEDDHLGTRDLVVDSAKRLLQIRQNERSIERYEYDAASNLTVASDRSPISVNDRNQAIISGALTFEYDADGQLSKKISPEGTSLYKFDGDGQLLEVSLPDGRVVKYSYDFLGRRISKILGGVQTRFCWDGMVMQAELTDGEAPRFFITLPGAPIPLAIVEGETIHTLLFDQIGTVTDAFDETGNRSWTCDATAFGHLKNEVGTLVQPIRALGQYHDRETGLYYNWRRYYDSLIGRYISVDPEPYFHTLNAYAFSPNPSIWVDVTGKGSLAAGILTLNPRCDWTSQQMKDFCQKIADTNAAIAKKGGALQISRQDHENYDPGCVQASKFWARNCAGKPGNSRRPVGKIHNDPCKDNDADHKLEGQLGGDDDCANLTPRNLSVNRSTGPQIDNALEKAFASASVTSVQITSAVAGTCKQKEKSQTSCNGRSGNKGC